MESIPLRKKILETIVSKSTLKQKVFDNTFATFNDLKETLLEMASEMDDQLERSAWESSRKALRLCFFIRSANFSRA